MSANSMQTFNLYRQQRTVLTKYTKKSDFDKIQPKNSTDSADIHDGDSLKRLKHLTVKTMILRTLLCFVFLFGFCSAQQKVSDTDKLLTADVLKATLFAKTPEEKKYCDDIIKKRNDGTVPQQIFYGVYQKALSKDRGRRFAYFKSGIEMVCSQRGISLSTKQ